MPYVTDTHAIIWHMTDNSRLSTVIKRIFEETDNGLDEIFVPCIILFELLYLIEKKKLSIDFNEFVTTLSSSRNYIIEPLCLPIIKKSIIIKRSEIPDPWDRLILATSIHLGFPLITCDERIQNFAYKLGLKTIW